MAVICVIVSILSDSSKEPEIDSEVKTIAAEQIEEPQNKMVENATDNTAESSKEDIPEEVISESTPKAKSDLKMLGNSQKYALEISGLPLFLCVDEEGGKVARVSNNASFGFEKIKPMKEMKSAEEVYGAGSAIGGYLSERGFNVDFAPDADVITNPQNTVIGDRSFGKDPELVKNYAAAYSDGLHFNGVLSTFKHFPGHGATEGDTHEGFAYTNKTLEELKQSELVPFMTAQEKGVDMVMISHISVPAILGDNTPCTLSRYMVTDVLKGELGYKGLIVTDAMNMGAITNTYGNDQAVVEAVKAGVDLILMPVDFKSAANAVVAAVESGEIEMDSIDKSVKKIIVKKLEI